MFLENSKKDVSVKATAVPSAAREGTFVDVASKCIEEAFEKQMTSETFTLNVSKAIDGKALLKFLKYT